MTTEKEPFEGDELVTETYSELGVEKAPEKLNQSILRMASHGGKQSPARGVLFAAWMKPVAWAATIGLSLAIVLELSQVPTVAVQSDDIPAAELMREEAALQDADVSEKTENRARLQSAPSREAISEDELGRSAITRDDVEILSREPKGKSALTEEISTTRKRAADLPADSQPVASYSLLMEQNESDIADSCDAAVRLSEESWLECIENLRRSGKKDAADRESEAFILEFSAEYHDVGENK
jgi:hypothetical protein